MSKARPCQPFASALDHPDRDGTVSVVRASGVGSTERVCAPGVPAVGCRLQRVRVRPGGGQRPGQADRCDCRATHATAAADAARPGQSMTHAHRRRQGGEGRWPRRADECGCDADSAAGLMVRLVLRLRCSARGALHLLASSTAPKPAAVRLGQSQAHGHRSDSHTRSLPAHRTDGLTD